MKYIIWGAKGHLFVVKEIMDSNNAKLVATFDNNKNLKIKNIPLFYGKNGFLEWSRNQKKLYNYYFITAIGGSNGNHRELICNYLESKGLNSMNIFHKSSNVSESVKFGKNNQILISSSISANTIVKNHVIINSNASVDHDCFLSDCVHIGPSAALAGCVKVGYNTFIGTNATVLPNITIGDNVIIGAGSVVTRDIPSNVIAYGNPCKVKSKIK